jgi:glycosyltransferase involved in cell wall biosynthesis
MKVVHVGSYDLPGQRFNGMVIHRSLLSQGHESNYLVDIKYSTEAGVHALGPQLLRRLNRLADRLEKRQSRQADLAVLGLGMFLKPVTWRADLVHLQLLHARSFFSLRMLPLLARGRRPVLWTLHDPWITTGHCVHSLTCDRWRTGCGDCPDLSLPLPIREDQTARNWRLKWKSLQRSAIHLIVASRWMEQRVAESPILQHLPRTLIPFGLDPQVFHVGDKAAARAELGIPPAARVAAVRWTPHNILKGTRFAEEALLRLPDGVVTHVLCFESDGADLEKLQTRFTVIPMPWLQGGPEVAQAMRAADVFLMPSVGETFGMMAIEAMACGTPVVVFEGTGLPDVVTAPHAGIAAPQGDTEALAAAITDLMTNSELRRSVIDKGLALVARDYTEATYLTRHLSLYEELIDAHRRAG